MSYIYRHIEFLFVAFYGYYVPDLCLYEMTVAEFMMIIIDIIH